MLQIKVVEKIKTHILCPITFFENRAVYVIMSKNMVEPEGPEMTSQNGAYELHAVHKRDYTHARACARAHASTLARTQTQTNM